VKLPWTTKRYEPYEFQALARYNSRRAEGIVHDPEYMARMMVEQARFDMQMRARR
jgi:hypothetical protein